MPQYGHPVVDDDHDDRLTVTANPSPAFFAALHELLVELAAEDADAGGTPVGDSTGRAQPIGRAHPIGEPSTVWARRQRLDAERTIRDFLFPAFDLGQQVAS